MFCHLYIRIGALAPGIVVVQGAQLRMKAKLEIRNGKEDVNYEGLVMTGPCPRHPQSKGALLTLESRACVVALSEVESKSPRRSGQPQLRWERYACTRLHCLFREWHRFRTLQRQAGLIGFLRTGFSEIDSCRYYDLQEIFMAAMRVEYCGKGRDPGPEQLSLAIPAWHLRG